MSSQGATHEDGQQQQQRFYAEEELAALIRALDRDEDSHLFAEDVLVTYPYLADSYTKVCPRRCDLATAARKALDDAYGHDLKLTDLKDDIHLMVSNCLRYNGSDGPLADIATRFEQFAMQQVDDFIASKTGGRRVSSLRLQMAAGASGPSRHRSATTPAAASATATAGGGARSAPASSSSSSSSVAAAGLQTPHVSKRELVELVQSLIRREDAGAFVVDVAEAYPELKASYEAVCPNKMNLTMMKSRAQSGYYHQSSITTTSAKPPPQPGSAGVTTTAAAAVVVFADTVADSLPRLREDIEVVVANCIRFNAQVEAWVTMALSFQRFAHRKVDDFVLRHVPALRGTTTGAERYCVAPPPQQQPATATGPSSTTAAPVTSGAAEEVSHTGRLEQHSGAPSPSPQAQEGKELSSSSVTARKRARGETEPAMAVPPPVRVEADVVPTVQPTPLQPAISVPPALRRRVVEDHLHRGSLSLRLVGKVLPASELLPPPPPPPVCDDAGPARSEDGSHLAAAASNGDVPAVCGSSSLPHGEKAETEEEEIVVPLTSSAEAVLRAFVGSVHAFFEAQQRRPDFIDPFSYGRHDEQLYHDVVEVWRAQFNRLFVHVLLYEKEAAEAHAWVAAHVLTKSSTEAASSTSATPASMDWAAVVHYTYLVRFLVHFPQLASLCCAKLTATAPAGASSRGNTSGSGGSRLSISRDTLGVLQQVAKVTQELLHFIAAYEDRLVSTTTERSGDKCV